MKIDKKKVKSILFITLNNLGDIILTTPVFVKLHQEFPEASIDVITGYPGREIFISHPAAGEVRVHGKRKSVAERIPQVVGLWRKRYDLVVDLKNSLLPHLIGAKYHSRFLTLLMGTIHRSKPCHKKEEHLAKLKDLGIRTSAGDAFFVPCSNEDKRYVSKLIEPGANRKTVVIGPGSKSHLKRWPAVKYAELGDRLVSELGCRLFFVGNELDKEAVEYVTSRMKEPFIDLCCRTSIPALLELMRRSTLVITNDSAPLHIASVAGTPTIAIFGPSDEVKYGPLAYRSRVVSPGVSCRPCSLANCAVGYRDGCIERVKTDEVYRAAKDILDGISI